MNAYTCSSALTLDRAARSEDSYQNYEVIATIYHEDETVTTHALYMSVNEGEDFYDSWIFEGWEAVNPAEFNKALETREEIEFEEWDGHTPGYF